jgi:environmental stress-induced protein Ves
MVGFNPAISGQLGTDRLNAPQVAGGGWVKPYHDDMKPSVIRNESLAVTRWVNGAGRKADIAVGDGWLLGFAWLDLDAPFSDYSGHDRTIMLLEGPGFSLDLPAGSVLAVTERFVPTAFDGAGPMACKVRGPCRVLNAISVYPGWSHTMQVIPGTDLAAVEPGEAVFAVVLRGSVDDAGVGDTLPITATTAGGDAILAIVRFEKDTA